MKITNALLLGMCLWPFGALAEYRAYELEVFDKLTKRSQVIITSFSPHDYVLTHGGPKRIGVITRASWMCYGDTSNFKETCKKPEAQNPKFQVGDKVQVRLSPHISDEWKGVVETSFFRNDLKSNVYGVRFPQHKNVFSRYYEANLVPLKEEE